MTVRRLVQLQVSPYSLSLDSGQWHRFDDVDDPLLDAHRHRETTAVVTGQVMLREAGRMEVEQAGEHLGLFSFLENAGTPSGDATTVPGMTKENRAAFLQVYWAETCSDWVEYSDESRSMMEFAAVVVAAVAGVQPFPGDVLAVVVGQEGYWDTGRCLTGDEHAYQPYLSAIVG